MKNFTLFDYASIFVGAFVGTTCAIRNDWVMVFVVISLTVVLIRTNEK
jgi:hypothetical protein